MFLILVSLSLPLYAADWTIGYEGNDQWAHGFLTVTQPVSRLGPGDLLAWGTVSYIRYDVTGAPDVTAPGIGGGALWRVGGRTNSFAIGPGYEVRWIDRGSGSETQSGYIARAEGHQWFGTTAVLLGGASYYDAIEWTTARSSLELSLPGDLRAGPEVAFHGNRDIDITELGGILRYPMGDRTSFVVRGGTARTKFRNGVTRDDPYFSVGIGHSIRF